MSLLKRGRRRLADTKSSKQGNLNDDRNSGTRGAELPYVGFQPDGTRKWPVSPTSREGGIVDGSSSNTGSGTGDWLLLPWVWCKPDPVEMALWGLWLDNQRSRRPLLSDEIDD